MGTALPACFTMRLEPSWETQRDNAAFTETSIARQTHLLGRFTVAVAMVSFHVETESPSQDLGGLAGRRTAGRPSACQAGSQAG